MDRYRLILLNDDEHSYQYVIEMLGEVLGLPERDGFRLAERIDRHGGATVLVGTLDEVAAAGRAILEYGPDPVIRHGPGSMRVKGEPVE
jgi:ATP-dependent Clp protease adaptor protein ClpS